MGKYILSIVLLISSVYIALSQEKHKSEAEGQIEILKRLNPGYNRLSQAEIIQKWRYVDDMQPYQADNRNAEKWKVIGPNGHLSSEGYDFYCSGRVRDVEILSDNLIRVATASGGLWEINIMPDGRHNFKNISDHQVLSSWSGCVSTDPYNQNTILYGTGEPGVKIGTGLWKSTDAGETWKQTTLGTSQYMAAFDEIEFTNKPGMVWSAGSDGVYFSANSGTSWILKKTGNHPGMVIYPEAPEKVLVSEYGRGIYRTKDGGNTWSLLTNGLPNSNFYRIELSNCKSKPDVIYALYTKNDQTTLGIYKTINGGDTWSRCTVINANGEPDIDYHWSMANYCSFISVSPVNPDHVLSGGGWYIYSIDGQNFYGPTEGQHADFHCGGWNQSGNKAYYGNDGGIFRTDMDLKWKWDHKINRIPITQFGTLAISRTDPNAIIGGTQDNGLVYYNSTGKNWFYYLGDGGHVAYDPHDENTIYATLGLTFGAPQIFTNFRKKGPSAAGWVDTPTGLDPSGQWWRLVRTDYNTPSVVYTETDNKVYYSENEGDTWTKFATNEIPIQVIETMRVSHGEYPKLYASGYGPDTSNCMMLDVSFWEWTNITAGLPSKNDGSVYSVPALYISDNPTYQDRVYALMKGYGPQLKGNIVFRSDNNGKEWLNISGNLPELPYTCLLEHPLNDQIIVVGTDGFGLFITDNGGKNWYTFNDSWPKGSLIAELDYQIFSHDSINIVAATYGHSILSRPLPAQLILSDETVKHEKFVNHISKAFFKEESLIIETRGLQGQYLLKVCNIEGKCILNKLVDVDNNGQVTVSSSNFIPGIYIASLQQNGKLSGTIKTIKTD